MYIYSSNDREGEPGPVDVSLSKTYTSNYSGKLQYVGECGPKRLRYWLSLSSSVQNELNTDIWLRAPVSKCLRDLYGVPPLDFGGLGIFRHLPTARGINHLPCGAC